MMNTPYAVGSSTSPGSGDGGRVSSVSFQGFERVVADESPVDVDLTDDGLGTYSAAGMAIDAIILADCASLISVDVSDSTDGGDATLDLSGAGDSLFGMAVDASNSELVSIDASGSQCKSLNISGCAGLVTLDLNGDTRIAGFNFTGCTSLTNLNLHNATFSQAVVNSLVDLIYANATEDGTIDLRVTGGVVPSAGQVTKINTMVSDRGFTITTN